MSKLIKLDVYLGSIKSVGQWIVIEYESRLNDLLYSIKKIHLNKSGAFQLFALSKVFRLFRITY
jgi:hypothetical protein